MSLTICTGWSPAGWNLYGAKFLYAFDRLWPIDVGLLVWGEYNQGIYPSTLPSGRRWEFTVLDDIPMWRQFEERHRNDLRARGRVPDERWKSKERQLGYSWRFDAYKWARQAFIPMAASVRADTEYLAWLDADVITHSRVAHEALITALIPEEQSIGYLGRGDKHPDIAFQLYRLGGVADDFLLAWLQLYATDKVFELAQWHSAWTWKYILDNHPMDLARFAHDITPNGFGHVWHQSPLRMWGDHLKGDRKHVGRSPERR